MINSYGDYMIVGVIKAFWLNKGVTQPQVSPTAQRPDQTIRLFSYIPLD